MSTNNPASAGKRKGAGDNGECYPAVRQRKQVARVTTEEHWEVVRADLLPLFVERRTLREIAKHFGVSTNTAGVWRSRLVEDIRREASDMSPGSYVLESITSLRLARAEAWKLTRRDSEDKEKRAALQLVATLENQWTKLGQLIGMYGRSDKNPLQDESNQFDEGAELLRRLAIEFLDSDLKQPDVSTDD